MTGQTCPSRTAIAHYNAMQTQSVPSTPSAPSDQNVKINRRVDMQAAAHNTLQVVLAKYFKYYSSRWQPGIGLTCWNSSQSASMATDTGW